MATSPRQYALGEGIFTTSVNVQGPAVGESYRAIAEDYGVTATTIHNVVTQYAA